MKKPKQPNAKRRLAIAAEARKLALSKQIDVGSPQVKHVRKAIKNRQIDCRCIGRNAVTVDGDHATINLVGQTDNGDGELFRQALERLDNVNRITVRINSPGGSFADSVQIFALLAEHPAHVTTIATGLCASGATIILQAGDRRIIEASCEMMIHEVQPTEREVRAFLQRVILANETLRRIYSETTGLSEEQLIELLSNGDNWVSPTEAVELGFADSLAGDEQTTNMTQAYLIENTIDADAEQSFSRWLDTHAKPGADILILIDSSGGDIASARRMAAAVGRAKRNGAELRCRIRRCWSSAQIVLCAFDRSDVAVDSDSEMLIHAATDNQTGRELTGARREETHLELAAMMSKRGKGTLRQYFSAIDSGQEMTLRGQAIIDQGFASVWLE